MISMFFVMQGTLSHGQNVNLENSWKLTKVEKDGVAQGFEWIMLIDPAGLVGCYNPYSEELGTNGTWEKERENTIKITRDGFVVNYIIHSWAATEIVIGMVEKPAEKLFFSK
jgi:hypothetical protein